MRLSLERKTTLGFAVALAALLLVGGVAAWSAVRVAATFRSVDHSHEVLLRLESTLTELLNLQTGARSFVLTGDPQFLTRYEAGGPLVAESIRLLRQLTADNPRQLQRLRDLEPAVARVQGILAERIAIRRRDGLAAAAQTDAFIALKTTMDEIRRLFTAMEDEERQLLSTRSSDAQAAARATSAIVALGGMIATILGVAAIAVARRDFRDRRRADDALRALNAQLDQRVRDRTAQLEIANLAMAREIAERVRAEAEIQRLNQDLERRVVERTAQLEAANQELEAFSYSVSHDLRAPLRHVDGFAGLLTKHAGKALDAQSLRYLTTISGAARQMGRLIDDLLSFSRMNRATLRLAAIDQNTLVSSVVRDGDYDQPGRAIAWDIAPLPLAQADEAMLRQVWVNLIENAVKYSGKNPQPRIAVGCQPDGGSAGEQVFFVRDNGVGFDMAYAGKLFGVFQRLHGPDEFDGTGIGLANVRRIVARHGGRTWAEGRVDAGAVFYFSLPVKSPSP